MIKDANRISIIGGCGTGKTVLANNLALELNLPIYHIDAIAHLENWKRRDKKERDEILLEKLSEPRWIIEGTYTSTLTPRLEKSDFVIYLDYSSMAQIKGILKRYIKNHGKEKKEIPGCKERMTLKFLFFTLNWRRKRRKIIFEKIKDIDKNKILIFRNQKKLNNWYEGTFNKKIKL